MENGNKRYGKKSDKETQSPVLKVFKEMIQREKNDPEKANLLKVKQENRKKRQYSGSRSKTDRINRSCDSSSSEKNRRGVQYKAAHEQRLKDYNQTSRSTPFQGDKKDSWWFWSDTQKKQSEDTCSCVSCALKKIISSEYTCIACLGVLFLISVLIAFLVLFKTVPIPAKSVHMKPTAKKPRALGSDVLKRKIDMIQKGVKEDGLDERPWDDTLTRHLSSLAGSHENDFDDGSFREFNTLEESSRSESELSSLLDAEKLNEGLSSERLRNFYKKLIQTDAQIRNMKKGINEYTQTNYEESKFNYPDRFKRSLRLGAPKAFLRYNIKKDVDSTSVFTENNTAALSKFNLFYPPYSTAIETNGKIKKYKRFTNGTDEPTGFVIEKKQIVVQYKPHDNLRKVPKCSHAPKDSKSHEKQMKHPFYKNTQRLDEMLDQFLDKNLPEMMVDPFGVDVLFKHNKDTKPHKTNVKIENEKVTKKPMTKAKNKGDYKDDKLFDFGFHRSSEKRVGELDREFFDMVSSKKKGKTLSSTRVTPSYDVILSVSTIVNPGQRKVSKPMNILGQTPSLLERVPHIRKLMQVDEEDEEGLGYEDLKEVLADDNEAHDETDKERDRKKRMDNDRVEEFKIPNNPYKHNPPGVHNPNWKGPMPLYPDELSSMIKQASIQNVQNFNKIHLPANTKDISSEADNLESDLNDMEYIENYSDNKFEKLAKMAQAYSDYGVLENKKDLARNEKEMDGKNAERRVKLSISKGKSLKNALFDRFKKSKVSEGIRFEIRPTTPSREDSPVELMKVLEKHVKVTNNRYFPPFHATTLPLNTEYALFSAIQKQQGAQTGDRTTKKDQQNEYPDNAVVFTFAKSGRRSLKSVEEDIDSSNENVGNLNNQEKNMLMIRNVSGLDIKHTNYNRTFEKYNMSKEKSDDKHNYQNANVNNSVSTEVKLEERVQSLNETNNIGNTKAIVTSKDTVNKNADGVQNNQDTSLITTILNLNKPQYSSDTGLSEFFRIMSNWFSVMAGFDSTSEANQSELHRSKLINKSATLNTTAKSNVTIYSEFPLYDTDMIENIGHRSRVLLSVDENNDKTTNTVDASEVNMSTSRMNGRVEKGTSLSSTIDFHKEDVSTASATISTRQSEFYNATSLNPNEKDLFLATQYRTVDNKTLVKRNVPGDSKLIFWNDIYDDEYGVKMDPVDDAVLEKKYSRSINFMKKSGNWIQDKVKNFANNFRAKEKVNENENTKRILRKANNREDLMKTYAKHNKRAANYEETELEDKSDNFAVLTAKMKEVCKEAAKAVQQTKNVQVRQNEKEDTMTTSLMQQLVRLMTDLIDFQVQQKTCVKLPPDLQDFLVWLTSSNSEQVEFRDQKTKYYDGNNFEIPSDQVLDLVTTPSSEKEIHADSRSECLGTLHSVQDLMQQYDSMTDEDKSKMTGIRDYLENQLQFLHKQLATFDGYKTSNMFEDPPYRFRRDLQSKVQNCRHKYNKNKNRKIKRNRFKRRFLKNFGKKHTRTTASIYDGFAMTEVNKYDKDGERYTNIHVDGKENNNVKRNLKDVYYKAVNDAKKSTTFKATLKDALEGFDHAQVVRIDN